MTRAAADFACGVEKKSQGVEGGGGVRSPRIRMGVVPHIGRRNARLMQIKYCFFFFFFFFPKEIFLGEGGVEIHTDLDGVSSSKNSIWQENPDF